MGTLRPEAKSTERSRAKAGDLGQPFRQSRGSKPRDLTLVDVGSWTLGKDGTAGLRDKTALDILSVAATSQGFCIWTDGILEILVPPETELCQLASIESINVQGLETVLSSRELIAENVGVSRRRRRSPRLEVARSSPRPPFKRSINLRRPVNLSTFATDGVRYNATSRLLSSAKPNRTGKNEGARPVPLSRVKCESSTPRGSKLVEKKELLTPRNRTDRKYVGISSECAHHTGEVVDGDVGTPHIPMESQMNGLLGRKSDSAARQLNGSVGVDGSAMASAAAQAPAPEMIPVTPTPPPATPPEQIPPEEAPARPATPPTAMNESCLIRVGSTVSTVGVKVRRVGSTESYLTISTQAAYQGICGKPLPFCRKEKHGLFHKKKVIPSLVGSTVVDASQANMQVGTIYENTDFHGTLPDRPIFPNDFCNNISLVGPLRPDILLPSRNGLIWSDRLNNMDGVSLRILGDKEEAKSFVAIGTYYGRSIPVQHDKQKLELMPEVIRKSILFRRKGYPPEGGLSTFSGAPVVVKGSNNEYSDIVGFQSFELRPAKAPAENLWDSTVQVMERLRANQPTTIYGALLVKDSFKDAWEIVD